VEFEFPGGTGSAIGLRYRPEEPRVRLEKDISIRVRRGGGAPVEIRGVALDYLAGAQAFELAAPLEVRVGDRALTAQRLRMELTQDYRTRRLEASGNAQMRVGQTGGPALLRAASAVAEYGASGRMEQVRAAGGVSFERRGPAAEEQLNCDEAVFLLDAAGKEIERAVARGHPRLISRRGVDTRELQAPVLELTVRPGGDRLVAPERGTLTLRGRPGDESNVTADRLELEFGAGRRLERLSAAGHVETRDFRAGKPLRTTGSDELRARFDAAGKVAEAHQTGRFRYAEDRRRAEAGRAEFAAALQTYTLREDPVVWDATSRTTARVITVNDTAGVFEAEGDVRTTRQPVAGSAGFDPTQPMNIAADRLRAENERGWARYEGRARLWQGENRLAAQVMEWLRSPGRLVAAGDVSGLFLERDRDGRSAERRAVEITSARFTYWESERRGEFDERVIARNDFGVLTAPHLEVFLASGEDRLERAHAVGGVGIERDGRRAVSDEAEYRAGEQTVVLWGGTPRISDPARGVTTGDRLTLSLADGTISVDSNERTRTLTRPPTTQ
jgi:lipopolysaccharide export system protein LptA